MDWHYACAARITGIQDARTQLSFCHPWLLDPGNPYWNDGNQQNLGKTPIAKSALYPTTWYQYR